jgi:CRP/FNR family transcriptional regulator, polysaccharide utilization system transcription regulator
MQQMLYTNPFIEICLESSYSVFKGLPDEQKEILVRNHSISYVKKGENITVEGEKAEGLICLISGKVRLFRTGVSGKSQIIKMIKPYGLIGIRTLFSENSWAVSATAIENSAFCIFERSAILKVLKNNPETTLRLLKMAADDTWLLCNRLLSLTQKHVRARLAESLLILRDTYGFEPDGRTLNVAVSRKDIASLSNMTTANAIRTLSGMAREGVIEINLKKIAILDNAGLGDIAETG